MKDVTELKVKVRMNAMTSKETEVICDEGDTLLDIFEKVCEENNIPSEIYDYFVIIMEGYTIDKELWEVTKPSIDTNILVALKPAGGGGRSTFKTVALILITAAVAVATKNAGPFVSAVLTATATIGASMALNSLFPEPIPGSTSLGGFQTSEESSQMYTIQAQSNTTKKYEGVPKVYGRHRFYPIIAANPYTDIGVDPSTGELVQYFYAIYDFGVGPLVVEDLKIGDTLISEFADISYRWVDQNKPVYAEGEEPEWEKYLDTDFEIYKGDGNTTTLSVAMNENKDDGADVSDYEVIRNVPGENDNNTQEISVTFLCPRGLDSVATNGDHSVRSIDLDIDFAEDGTEDWIPYADFDYTLSNEVVGGQDSTRSGYSYFYPSNVAFNSSNGMGTYTYLKTVNGSLQKVVEYGTKYYSTENTQWTESVVTGFYYYRYIDGYVAKGDTSIILKSGIGDFGVLTLNGTNLGKVTSIDDLGNGYSEYHLETPVPKDIRVYRRMAVEQYKTSGGWSPWILEGDVYSESIKYQYQLGSRVTISASTSKPLYAVMKVKPIKNANYKMRVRRLRSYGPDAYSVVDDLTWSTLSTRFDRSPISSKVRHTFLEIGIRATNQLNGSIQNLSGVVTSILDVYDPNTQTWSKEVTNNPAWVFCDLLTGELNKRAVDRDRLEMSSIIEWRDYCDEVPPDPPNDIAPLDDTFSGPRFRSNFVLDFEVTLQQALNKVANACQASLNLIDGKYGVLIDKKRTIPVQLFTNRNSKDFSSVRSYNDTPHALRIKYIDPVTWEYKELTTYADGYDALTATEFETMSTFGCTDIPQAWRFGRYALAISALRKELISIQVDFEHLVCTRGDYVQISQDVMKVGGMPARVIKVLGNVVTIDSKFTTAVGTDYGYTFRPYDGDIETSSMTVTSPNTATVDGSLPGEGDLILWGEVGHITFDCMVKSITPANDLQANLLLVEKADGIYDAESTGALPSYDPYLNIVKSAEDQAPSEVQNLNVADSSYYCTGYKYQYYVDLDWLIPEGSVYEAFEIYADSGKGFSLVETNSNIGYRYEVDEANLDIEHQFKVIAVSSNGNKLPLGEVTSTSATPTPKATPPSDVESLFLNVTGETIQIDWPALTDCDVLEYLIRFSPSLTGTWESSIPLQRVDRRTTLATSQARTGTYLIKAVDFNGNESDNSALAITSIPDLVNLNAIEVTNDFPALLGSKEQVINDGGNVLLQEKVVGGVGTGEYYSTGEYYFEKFLDLGEIYTVRLQSLIEAEGFTQGDIMSTWASMSDVLALTTSRFSEWNVETYYRATESFNTISDWATLSSVESMSEGSSDIWSPWRKFTMGDFTGRIFQFKLKLISNKPSVTPRVLNGVIKSDMPDRRDVYNNLITTTSGLNVVYDLPFKGPGLSPTIQITQDNAENGDYYKLTNRTLSGCTVTIFDKDDNQVIRQFDLAAGGYGRKTGQVL